MAWSALHGMAAAWQGLRRPPERAPRWAEAVVAIGLRSAQDEVRLGDLSELYVRSHRRASAWLGAGAAGVAVAHLLAGLGYLSVAGNVVLFTRAVDPGRRLVEHGAAALVGLDLRERTMAMTRAVAARLLLPALLLIAGALLVNGAVDVWTSWRESTAMLGRLQREKAESAAARIQMFIADLQRQVGWTTNPLWAGGSVDQRRADYLRLMRQAPEITEIAQLDAEGRELLRVSRLAMDKVDSGADFSQDKRFTEARAHDRYFSDLYFRKSSEPYLSLAIAHGGSQPGVTLAEINLKPVWDVVRSVKIGDRGYAYVVDRRGRLIAHPDFNQALRNTDLSGLPQVAAALAAPPASGPAGDAAVYDASPAGGPVLSAHAAIPALGWQLFVELPRSETHAALWSAVLRTARMLGLGLLVAVLAALAVARRTALRHPTPA